MEASPAGSPENSSTLAGEFAKSVGSIFGWRGGEPGPRKPVQQSSYSRESTASAAATEVCSPYPQGGTPGGNSRQRTASSGSRRDSRLPGITFVVGQRVQAFTKAGSMYGATIYEVHDGGKAYTVDWDDCDPQGRRVAAADVMPADPRVSISATDKLRMEQRAAHRAGKFPVYGGSSPSAGASASSTASSEDSEHEDGRQEAYHEKIARGLSPNDCPAAKLCVAPAKSSASSPEKNESSAVFPFSSPSLYEFVAKGLQQLTGALSQQPLAKHSTIADHGDQSQKEPFDEQAALENTKTAHSSKDTTLDNHCHGHKQ
eukprot:COSAG05_NODE_5832_length_1078_cov_0.917263_1_plen_315_part_10